MIKRQQELQAYEQHEVSELNELEATVRTMHGEMINLQKRCSNLTADLERQKNMRRELESQIDKHQRIIMKVRRVLDARKSFSSGFASDILRRNAYRGCGGSEPT